MTIETINPYTQLDSEDYNSLSALSTYPHPQIYIHVKMTTISWDFNTGKWFHYLGTSLKTYQISSGKQQNTVSAGQLYMNLYLILMNPPQWKTHNKPSF